MYRWRRRLDGGGRTTRRRRYIRRCARLDIVNVAGVGTAKRLVAEKVVLRIVYLENKVREQNVGPNIIRGVDTTALTTTMATEREKRTTKAGDVQSISGLDNFTVETIDCTPYAFYLNSGVIAENGIFSSER